MFVARASADPAFIMLVSEWGGDGYFSHSKSLKFNERGLDLATAHKGLSSSLTKSRKFPIGILLRGASLIPKKSPCT